MQLIKHSFVSIAFFTEYEIVSRQSQQVTNGFQRFQGDTCSASFDFCHIRNTDIQKLGKLFSGIASVFPCLSDSCVHNYHLNR